MVETPPDNGMQLTALRAAAQQRALARSVLDTIDNSQKFAEGRAVRFEV